MTILVDEPRWEWHGTTWSHLVSDTSVTELHRFARRVRMRYLSYQGDHYDLPVGLFDRAVDAGAQVVDSRELVRRLREAGLRRRSGKSATTWTMVAEGAVAVVGEQLDESASRLLADLARHHGADGTVTLLSRPSERVTLLRLADATVRFRRGVHLIDDDCAVVESHDPRGHTLEIVWRSGAGRELHHG